VYTRLLGPEEYGSYALVVAAVTLVELIVFGWVSQAIIRYLPSERSKEGEARLLATAFLSVVMMMAAVVVPWLLSTVVVESHSARLASLLRVGLLTLASAVALDFVLALARAKRLRARYAVATGVGSLGTVGVAVLLLRTAGEAGEAILVAEGVVLGAVAVYELWRNKAHRWARASLFSTRWLRTFFSYGLPLVGASLGALVLSVADRYMLEYLGGPGDVGSYAAGYDLADKSLKVVFSVLVAAALPVIVRVATEAGNEAAVGAVEDLLGAYLVVMLPLTVAMVTFNGELVTTVLGSGFEKAALVVPWVAVGTLCWGAAQILAQGFLVNERTMPLFSLLLLAAVLNIALNLALIPALGTLGAAISTTATYAAYLVLLAVRRVGSAAVSWPWKGCAKALLAAAAMYASLRLSPLTGLPTAGSIPSRVLVGAVAYVLVLYLTRHEAIEGLLVPALRRLQRG
jgi:O-antigen/teichoic acid export membrane protein